MKTFSKLFGIREGSKVNLKKHDPALIHGFKDEEEAEEEISNDIKKMVVLQEKLYSDNRYSMLIILQAMDAAGKDGVIKHITEGLNAQGCMVHSFKHPSDEEYDHDFLWRYSKALPEIGRASCRERV